MIFLAKGLRPFALVFSCKKGVFFKVKGSEAEETDKIVVVRRVRIWYIR